MAYALTVEIYHNQAGTRLLGYQDGDPLRLVHDLSFGWIGHDGYDNPRLIVPGRTLLPVCTAILRQVACAVVRILSRSGVCHSEWELEKLRRYRETGLRRPEAGDVLVIDPGGPHEWRLARHFSGWFTVTGPLNVIELEGSRLWARN